MGVVAWVEGELKRVEGEIAKHGNVVQQLRGQLHIVERALQEAEAHMEHLRGQQEAHQASLTAAKAAEADTAQPAPTEAAAGTAD